MNRIQMLLLFALVFLIALTTIPASADTAMLTIHPGENWISLPLVPLNNNPAVLFEGIDIDQNLAKFDPSTQKSVLYDSSNPDNFGALLLGEGYILNYTGTEVKPISYEGARDGLGDGNGNNMTDMWISLVNETNWIGQPFNHITPFSSLLVTDLDSMVSVDEAISRGWLDGLWTTMDNETKETHTVGLSSLKADDLYLRPGSMYKVTTHVDQLGLIIHAYTNVPEPSSILSLIFGLGGAGGMMLRRKR